MRLRRPFRRAPLRLLPWAAVACALLTAAGPAAADRIVLYTGREIVGKVIERTDRTVRIRSIRPGGIVMDEVFSVDEVETVQIDAPPQPPTRPSPPPATRPAPASQPAGPPASQPAPLPPASQPAPPPASQPTSQPTSLPASRPGPAPATLPASRPASLPAPAIPTPWPDDSGLGPDESILEPEESGEQDPFARFDRALQRALAMRKEKDKLGAFVRTLTVLVNAADDTQRFRMSEICKDQTARSLAELLAESRVAWAGQRGYGRKFRLVGVTQYEKNELLLLLDRLIEANRAVVGPFTTGAQLPSYEHAPAVRKAADLLEDQLREWMLLQPDLDARLRAACFAEIRVLRDVRIKAGKALQKGPPKGKSD